VIEIGPHHDVAVPEPAEIDPLILRIAVREGAPGGRDTLVEQMPPFPGMLVLVGRLVVKGDEGVIMETQDRRQHEDEPENQHRLLG
jgi:hypothetical protein